MSFLKNLFSRKARAEDIIKTTTEMYWHVRNERPGEDEHIYLSTTLMRKFASAYFPDETITNPELYRGRLESICSGESHLFSVLDPPDSIRALAIYMAYKSLPAEAAKYLDEYNRLMGPTLKLREDEKAFIELYKKKNPKIAKEMKDLE
jgi:hypothetical protein